ncbi:hypothetical protein ACF0H5_014093 [Mactra antiquata]
MTDMWTFMKMFLLSTVVSCAVEGCMKSEWRNLTMEEILLKSDLVVYGKDTYHGKFRNPIELDARFTVYCVIKSGKLSIPGQLVIENIRGNGNLCSGVAMQTLEGNEYIVGLSQTLSGYAKYAEINVLQKSAFPPTNANFEKLAATCDLDNWKPPITGDQDKCPTSTKPRFCTKIRDPVISGKDRLTISSALYLMMSVLIFYK